MATDLGRFVYDEDIHPADSDEAQAKLTNDISPCLSQYALREANAVPMELTAGYLAAADLMRRKAACLIRTIREGYGLSLDEYPWI